MSLPYAIFWLAFAVLFAIIEIATPSSLICVWFAVGAIVSALMSFVVDIFWVLFIIFVVISLVLFLFLRPIAKKSLEGRRVHTNADKLIGCIGEISETADDEHGLATVKNQVWTVRSDDGQPIEPGEKVKVLRIEGVKLIVCKSDEEPNMNQQDEKVYTKEGVSDV